MASRQPNRLPHQLTDLWLTLMILLLMAALISGFLRTDSFTPVEASISWFIQPDSWRELLTRWRDSGQAPLYPALLKMWSLVFGGVDYGLRWPTLAVSLLGVAVAFASLRHLFDVKRVRLGVALLGGWGLLLGYALRADGVAWAVLLGWVTSWVLFRGVREPMDKWRGLIWMVVYVGVVSALLYSHYAGVYVVAAHGAYVLIGKRRRWVWLGGLLAAVVVWMPWVVWAREGFGSVFISQMLSGLPVMAGVLVMLGVLRVIASVREWERWVYPLWAAVIAVSLLMLPRPTDWRGVIDPISRVRQPFEPIITDFPANSVQGHYDAMFGLQRGIAVRLGWQSLTADVVRERVDTLSDSPVVWVMVEADRAAAWDLLGMLGEGRTITFQTEVDGTLIARLE
jgi:hypothetical protein